jgi:hypothetical protein
MKTPAPPQVIKEQNGKKIVYSADGKVLRNSTKDYNYALFGLLNTEWNPETRQKEASPLHWNLVGFGNDPIYMVWHWRNIFHCIQFAVVNISQTE